MIRKILVGLDPSALSEQVLQQVIAIAQRCDAELKILHVLTGSEPEAPQPVSHSGEHYYPVTHQSLIEAYQRDWNTYMDNRQAWLAQQAAISTAAGIPTTHELVYGLPSKQICHQALHWQADLIAVGSRGRTGLSELLLGSVSNDVMRRATCSVVIIHPERASILRAFNSTSNPTDNPTSAPASNSALSANASPSAIVPQHILVPVDRSEAAAQALQEATGLAQAYGAEIRLLHVLADNEPDSPPIPLFDGSYYIANSALSQQRRHDWHHFVSSWNKFVNGWWSELSAQASEVKAAGISVSYDIMQGQKGHKICQAASDWSADLIVMGARRRSGLKQIFVDSTSHYVSHHASCSVWITHAQLRDTPKTPESRVFRSPVGAW